MSGTANPFPGLVFIVEDNSMYAKTLQVFLKTRFPATEVELFSEGEPVLNNLHRKPDFIIMDYYLNGENSLAADGLTVIKAIKARDEEVIIFALSAQQDIKIALEVKEANCLYLVKNNEAFKNLEELMVRAMQ